MALLIQQTSVSNGDISNLPPKEQTARILGNYKKKKKKNRITTLRHHLLLSGSDSMSSLSFLELFTRGSKHKELQAFFSHVAKPRGQFIHECIHLNLWLHSIKLNKNYLKTFLGHIIITIRIRRLCVCVCVSVAQIGYDFIFRCLQSFRLQVRILLVAAAKLLNAMADEAGGYVKEPLPSAEPLTFAAS